MELGLLTTTSDFLYLSELWALVLGYLPAHCLICWSDMPCLLQPTPSRLPLLSQHLGDTCSSLHQSHGSLPPRPAGSSLTASILQHLYLRPPTVKTAHRTWYYLHRLVTHIYNLSQWKVKNGKRASKAQNKYKYLPGLYFTCKREYHLLVLIFEGCNQKRKIKEVIT